MRAIASPSVRRLARERNIDIDKLAQDLGRETIAREDVLGTTLAAPTLAAPTLAVGGQTASVAAYWDIDHTQWGDVKTEPLSRVEMVASANLTAAQQCIPAVTHHDSADVSRLEHTRKSLGREGVKVTALAFHIAVLARCLKDFPRFNASLSADGQTLFLKQYVHIGIAVDTPYGLVVPVIRDADTLSLSEIAAQISDFAARAQIRKIRGKEMGGASMTITNLGAIGGEAFNPIINPPEVAILGISRVEIRPVWDGATFQPVAKVPLDLSYDHRIINGATAARFLVAYSAFIANPDDLLV